MPLPASASQPPIRISRWELSPWRTGNIAFLFLEWNLNCPLTLLRPQLHWLPTTLCNLKFKENTVFLLHKFKLLLTFSTFGMSSPPWETIDILWFSKNNTGEFIWATLANLLQHELSQKKHEEAKFGMVTSQVHMRRGQAVPAQSMTLDIVNQVLCAQPEVGPGRSAGRQSLRNLTVHINNTV